MALTIKDLLKREERLSYGHRLCPGCGAALTARLVMLAVDEPVVVSCATGCLEVSTTIYPYTAWRVPWIHNAFENAAATIAGVEAAYKALRKKGKIDKEVKFIAFGGDGGTYDIGLQALSGALERGHDFLYICYNNEGYMNTGAQRSGGTPKGANTTTAPAGKVIPGKPQWRKDLTAIVAGHHIPYVAQTTLHNPLDLVNKVRKAIETPGPSFINVLAPCVRFWRISPSEMIKVCKLAVDTCFWPVFEVIDDEWKLSYKPRQKKPIEEFLKVQGRFRHLFKPENRHIIDEIQKDVDRQWEYVLRMCGEKT
ncbi:MAG: pyruvate ferredoxin oxidoreductase [Synergistetes bacterium]|nr:pyruvate ferredoxin oxidoreductase [Synergistota bacterium]